MSYFWIDAPCINQADLEERSHQVSIMFRIYARADQVLVCLGLPFEGYEEAVQTVYGVASGLRSRYKTTPELATEELTEYIMQSVERLLRERTVAEADESPLTRIGLTLAAGYYPFAEPEEDMGETHFGAFLETTTKSGLCRRLSDPARARLWSGLGDAARYLLQVRIHSHCRCIFYTSRGHIVLGPQHMKDPEVVCIPAGSAFPWILRREEDHYIFMGQCYLYGVMEVSKVLSFDTG